MSNQVIALDLLVELPIEQQQLLSGGQAQPDSPGGGADGLNQPAPQPVPQPTPQPVPQPTPQPDASRVPQLFGS